MVRPTVRTVITAVQQALVETIDLALRRRFSVRDFGALRSFASANPSGNDVLPHRELIWVAEQGRNYRYDVTAAAPDDGQVVITPTGRASKRGRWLRCELADRYGRFPIPLHGVPPLFMEHEPGRGFPRYAREVQLYEGDSDTDAMEERLFGQRPSFLVKWEEDEVRPRSSVPGCLYFGPQRFTILAIATNNRPDASALQGSPFDADQQQEGPGLNRMLGDLRYVLAGAKLGLGPYVDRTEIGSAKITDEDLSQRLFVGTLSIEVFVSVHLAEEYLLPIESISVQPLLASGDFSEETYVAEGLEITPGPGLERLPSRGIVIMGSARIAYEPAPLRFPPSSDCYLDLQADGTLRSQAVGRGAAAPALFGALRVGLVQTDAASVAGYQFLCASLVRWRGPYEV